MTPRALLPIIAAALLTIPLGAVPAQASPGDAVAKGTVGRVTATVDGEAVTVAPIAPCDTAGPPQGSSGAVEVSGFVTFASGTTTCTVDDAGELASVEVTGGRFRLDALREYGGPRIRMSSFTARCQTTANGSTSSVRFEGLSGFAVPAELPANHVVEIPGDGGPIARITLNETIVPTPADGSMTVNLMHVRLLPASGDSGDIVVGSVHCAPVD